VYQERTVRERAAGVHHPTPPRTFWGPACWARAETTLAAPGGAGFGTSPRSSAQPPYGYQKVLGLGIALAARPRLAMLDEPAAGLSHDEAVHVADEIRRINADGVSLIVVDHNMRFMSRLCHRIVVLHHGTELATGTPQEVTRDPRVVDAYLGTVHDPA
jgi:ABC-type branched-subunit amino acid transport system ATPase component